jgi:hypothetical protein
MAGEIFYQVTVAEVREIKKDPEKIRSFDRRARTCIALEHAGYNIDLALEYLADRLNLPALGSAVSCEMDVGSSDCPVRHTPAKSTAEIAKALSAVSKALFLEAFDIANPGCEPDLGEYCFAHFKDLAEFFEDAAKKRKAVVKTIY